MTKTSETPQDFSAFLLSPTGRVEINLPSGDPMLYEGQPVAIHVYAPASAEYARAEAAMQRAARDKLLSGKRGNANAAEEGDEINARFLVAVTSSVENFPYPGGPEALYRERGLMYIGEQVRAFLGDQGNFFKGSKKS